MEIVQQVAVDRAPSVQIVSLPVGIMNSPLQDQVGNDVAISLQKKDTYFKMNCGATLDKISL